MNDTTDFDQTTGEIIEPITTTALSVVSAEIDVQIATAKRFPRRKDKDIATKVMDRAVLTSDIATECIYTIPRDGKSIIGPSIRFAEIVRSCFGNIRVASRFVRIDNDDRSRQAVIVEAVAYDTEMNDSECSQVRRSIMTSAKGGNIPRPFSVDMIATTIMAAQAIARRNAILALVPKALWIDAHMKVLEVVRGKADTLAERRTKMIDAFKQMGVEPEQLFEAMGVDSEVEISLNDMPRLTGMWTALRDGEAAESVLGMAIPRRPTHQTVENPLKNHQPEPMRGAPALHHKDDKDAARQEPAGEPSAKTTPRRGRPPKQPQEAAATPPETRAEEIATRRENIHQYEEQSETEGDGIPGFLKREAPAKQDEPPHPEGFLHAAIAHINAYNGPAEGLIDWFRSMRKERAELSMEDQSHLTKHYNAKFNDLSGV